MNKIHWSTKLGFFLGPLMILLAILAMKFSNKSPNMAYLLLALGIVRTAMSAFLIFKKNNNNEPRS